MMKNFIFLLCFGTAFTYDANHQKNLFEPAPYKSDISEEKSPQNFFVPNFYPTFERRDNLNEQVVGTSFRKKRDTSGALHIMTNHALPIHTDVKPDGSSLGDTEKVTAPEDTFYELKSLRKSWPLPNKLELMRSISRVITLAVLLASAVVEFFPLLKSLYNVFYSFIYL